MLKKAEMTTAFFQLVFMFLCPLKLNELSSWFDLPNSFLKNTGILYFVERANMVEQIAIN